MVYDKVWRGMAWYMEMLMRVSCFMALPWVMVPFTCGEADVSWRSCSHVQLRPKGLVKLDSYCSDKLLFILSFR